MEEENTYQNLLAYAQNLLGGAIKEFATQNFRMADVWAICAFSAADFVEGLAEPELQLRDRAISISRQAKALSKQAHSHLFFGYFDPKMNGVQVEEDDETEYAFNQVSALVKEIAHRRTFRRG